MFSFQEAVEVNSLFRLDVFQTADYQKRNFSFNDIATSISTEVRE